MNSPEIDEEPAMAAGANFKQRCSGAACRACGCRGPAAGLDMGLAPVLDLGLVRLSDGLLSQAQLAEPERRYPLEVAFCPSCSLVQILETVPPDVLFGADYPYYSSFSDHLLRHSRENALNLVER